MDDADKSAPYNDAFYDWQVAGSYRSAKKMLSKLSAHWIPKSVVDVGCGRGAWLQAFAELGSAELYGLDGYWNSQEKMITPGITFQAMDFNAAFDIDRTFDLALSLEVAEHCKPDASTTFFTSLTALADAVIFGAAFSKQPGVNHINCQPHSFWCQKFTAAGYATFDYFRPTFWGVPEVAAWYQQNTFLYVKPQHPLFSILRSSGSFPLENLAFVDAIHPWLFGYYAK